MHLVRPRKRNSGFGGYIRKLENIPDPLSEYPYDYDLCSRVRITTSHEFRLPTLRRELANGPTTVSFTAINAVSWRSTPYELEFRRLSMNPELVCEGPVYDFLMGYFKYLDDEHANNW